MSNFVGRCRLTSERRCRYDGDMSDGRSPEDELRELAERFGLRLVPLRERWFEAPRGRIRAAAWTALGALLLLVPSGTLLFSVSETVGMLVAFPSAAVLFLALAVISVEIFVIGSLAEDEDDDERAVARMVSGKGVDPGRRTRGSR